MQVGFLGSAEALESEAEVELGFGEGRSDVNGFGEETGGVEVIALSGAEVAGVVIGLGKFRVEAQRQDILPESVGGFAFFLEKIAEIVSGIGIIGLEAQ